MEIFGDCVKEVPVVFKGPDQELRVNLLMAFDYGL